MCKVIDRWREKASRENVGLVFILVKTVFSRLRIFILPIIMIARGKKFDFFGWQSLKIHNTSFWNPTIEHPKRALQTDFLWNQINLTQARTVLEVGSLSGYRLFDVAARFPNIRFFGVDICEDGVKSANLETEKRKLSNLEFFHFDITSDEFYSFFHKKHFDIIFSFATLMYIHPKDIRRLLSFMFNNASMQLLLVEQSNSQLRIYPSYIGIPMPNNPNWIRNYTKLIRKIAEARNFRITSQSVSSNIWTPGGGNAQVISITFSE